MSAFSAAAESQLSLKISVSRLFFSGLVSHCSGSCAGYILGRNPVRCTRLHAASSCQSFFFSSLFAWSLVEFSCLSSEWIRVRCFFFSKLGLARQLRVYLRCRFVHHPDRASLVAFAVLLHRTHHIVILPFTFTSAFHHRLYNHHSPWIPARLHHSSSPFTCIPCVSRLEACRRGESQPISIFARANENDVAL